MSAAPSHINPNGWDWTEEDIDDAIALCREYKLDIRKPEDLETFLALLFEEATLYGKNLPVTRADRIAKHGGPR